MKPHVFNSLLLLLIAIIVPKLIYPKASVDTIYDYIDHSQVIHIEDEQMQYVDSNLHAFYGSTFKLENTLSYWQYKLFSPKLNRYFLLTCFSCYAAGFEDYEFKVDYESDTPIEDTVNDVRRFFVPDLDKHHIYLNVYQPDFNNPKLGTEHNPIVVLQYYQDPNKPDQYVQTSRDTGDPQTTLDTLKKTKPYSRIMGKLDAPLPAHINPQYFYNVFAYLTYEKRENAKFWTIFYISAGLILSFVLSSLYIVFYVNRKNRQAEKVVCND